MNWNWATIAVAAAVLYVVTSYGRYLHDEYVSLGHKPPTMWQRIVYQVYRMAVWVFGAAFVVEFIYVYQRAKPGVGTVPALIGALAAVGVTVGVVLFCAQVVIDLLTRKDNLPTKPLNKEEAAPEAQGNM